MPDRFSDRATAFDGPASHGFAVSPSDSLDLVETTRAIFVGGPGSLRLITASGADLIFSGLAGGTVLPVRAQRIMATGTTAGALLGLV